MDAIALARWQFGITTVYHFFFVPLTLGLAPLVAIMETFYVQTGEDSYKRMAQFWGKLFLINFAMGIVTGIVQEFQFGMNWSTYSRFVGDIFGAPLAIEALLAFYLEATFIGVWFFGWDRLSKKVHLAAIWLVAFAVNLSALWILIANSFMQEPMGYVLRHGRAEMTDFFKVVFNPNVLVQFPHVVLGGVCTAAFFVLGISAWHLLRQSNQAFFRRSAVIALVYGLIGTLGVSLNGHAQAQHMVQVQPMKMAAAEALWKSESPASFSLFTFGNEPERRDVWAIRIPRMLTVLAYNRLDGEVKGITNLEEEYRRKYGPGNYTPPIAVTYWTFRFMIGAGTLMILLVLVGLALAMKQRLEQSRWFLRWMPLAILLPYIGNTAGWLMTELGRQPWIVFGVMRTENGISPGVSTAMVATTLIGFTLLYGALMVVDLMLLRKFAQAGPVPEGQPTLLGSY